jgi:hypothetical protein
MSRESVPLESGAMRRPPAKVQAHTFWSFVVGSRGACVRLVLSWTVAGGVAGGGILVGALTIAGVVEPGLQLLAAPVLFLAGAFLGLLHGGVLSLLGRPRCLTRGTALRHAIVAALLSLPLLGIGWLVTASIALTAALMREMRASWLFFAVGGWILGLALCAWALVEGWRALRTAMDRWPDGRVGSVLLTAILGVTTVLFVYVRPPIVGTDLRVNGLGAVALAVTVTLWVALPTVWAALHFLRQSHLRPHIGGGEAGS